MTDTYEVYAIRYGAREGRTRRDSFVFTERPNDPHPIDYFIWVVRNDDRTVLVDTGYDHREGEARQRPVFLEPAEALAEIGVRPDRLDSIVVTHLHYDHAGGLEHFPGARIHLQDAEMAYATGRCMCTDHLREPFTAGHVCEAIQRVYSGLCTFHDGDSAIAPGITLHRVGGHSRGLQCVRVETANGPVVLASDASHFYENFEREMPFPIVVDVEDMLAGFTRLRELAGPTGVVVPGHDPLVRERFRPAFEGAKVDVRRLDLGEV